jgi:hypothetical protein
MFRDVELVYSGGLFKPLPVIFDHRSDLQIWAVRNCFQVGFVLQGAGSTPSSCKICQTVEAAIGWSSFTRSPCPRRWPPRRIVHRHTRHELPITAAIDGPPDAADWRNPICGDQSLVPGQKRRRGHREHGLPPGPREADLFISDNWGIRGMSRDIDLRNGRDRRTLYMTVPSRGQDGRFQRTASQLA